MDDRDGPNSGRPIKFVYFDKDGIFKMDPLAIDVLRGIPGPVAVVSVCGPPRQGKSFILNQLLGKSPGFQIASTHQPCTEGLWMWNTPLKRIAPDGTEYDLLLFDSGGFNASDQTVMHSLQMVSLAVLLSSMFVYNQVGVIDEAALDRLFLVTEITKHIHGRASEGNDSTTEFVPFSPDLVWLLQDFYLDLVEGNTRITSHDYLDLALRPMVGSGKDIETKNQIRESIRAAFPKRECFTLVHPLNIETDLQHLDQVSLNRFRPEFRSRLDALAKFVYERIRPKQVGGAAMTGPVLAAMAKSFMDVLNNGTIPPLSSSWQICTRDTLIEANLQCSDAINSMEKKLGEACLVVDARIETIAAVLESLVSEYEASVHCPAKWQKLSSFLKKSLQGPLLLYAEKQIDDIPSKKSLLLSKSCSIEDKIELLHKQLEASDKLKAEYQKRYDDAIKDFQKVSDQYKNRMIDLEKKYSLLEERYSGSLELLDSAKQESLQWERKYEDMLTVKGTPSNGQVNENMAVLKAGVCEGKAEFAAPEESRRALEEAEEWKRKHDAIVNELEAAMEKAKRREEELTAKFIDNLAEKDKEIKEMVTKLGEAEHRLTSLTSDLKAAETKMESYELESSTLKLQIKELAEKSEVVEASSQSMDKEAHKMLVDEKQLKRNYLSGLKRRFKEAFKVSMEECQINEIIETAQSEAFNAQNGNSCSQHLTTNNETDILEREKMDLDGKIDGKEAILMEKITALEAMVGDREQVIELLKKKCNQCGHLIQIYGSSQLESTLKNQNSLKREPPPDVNFNESPLCPSVKTYSSEKCPRLEIDGEMKKPTLEKCTASEVDSVLRTDEEVEDDHEVTSADCTKLTVVKLRKELNEHGFGSELKKLKYSKKKDLLALYRTLVLKK